MLLDVGALISNCIAEQTAIGAQTMLLADVAATLVHGVNAEQTASEVNVAAVDWNCADVQVVMLLHTRSVLLVGAWSSYSDDVHTVTMLH